jgi:hypothetical protein
MVLLVIAITFAKMPVASRITGKACAQNSRRKANRPASSSEAVKPSLTTNTKFSGSSLNNTKNFCNKLTLYCVDVLTHI